MFSGHPFSFPCLQKLISFRAPFCFPFSKTPILSELSGYLFEFLAYRRLSSGSSFFIEAHPLNSFQGAFLVTFLTNAHPKRALRVPLYAHPLGVFRAHFRVPFLHTSILQDFLACPLQLLSWTFQENLQGVLTSTISGAFQGALHFAFYKPVFSDSFSDRPVF